LGFGPNYQKQELTRTMDFGALGPKASGSKGATVSSVKRRSHFKNALGKKEMS
jgi:hypothetical protein